MLDFEVAISANLILCAHKRKKKSENNFAYKQCYNGQIQTCCLMTLLLVSLHANVIFSCFDSANTRLLL